MAERILFGGLKLGRGHFESGWDEDRVIAEPTAPTWAFRDVSFPCALGDQGCRIVRATRQHDDASKPRRTPLGGHTAQLSQKLREILLVGCAFACEAGRADTRSPVKRVDLDPGVIGKCGNPCDLRGMPRLDQGIGYERFASLQRRFDAQCILGNQLVAESSQHSGKLTQLAPVAARKNDAQRQNLGADCSACS